MPPHRLLVAREKGGREELDELVLHVLDEVEVGSAASLHHEDGEVLVRLLDARVQHADQDLRGRCMAVGRASSVSWHPSISAHIPAGAST